MKMREKLRRLASVFILIVTLLFAVPLSADVPLKGYVKLRNHPIVKKYFVGVVRGVFWANTVLMADGKKPLFCIPDKVALDEGLIYSIIDHEVRSHNDDPRYSDMPVELIAVRAFIARFPCKWYLQSVAVPMVYVIVYDLRAWSS